MTAETASSRFERWAKACSDDILLSLLFGAVLSATIAVIALGIPVQPVTRDILLALTKAYRAGWADALNQSAAKLGEALARRMP